MQIYVCICHDGEFANGLQTVWNWDYCSVFMFVIGTIFCLYRGEHHHASFFCSLFVVWTLWYYVLERGKRSLLDCICMMRVRYIRILGLFVTPICSAHCVAHAVCLAAVKTVNAFFDHLHFVVCRSYSNTTDYGGDNFDDGHSE